MLYVHEGKKTGTILLQRKPHIAVSSFVGAVKTAFFVRLFFTWIFRLTRDTDEFVFFHRSYSITSSSVSRACSSREYAPTGMGFRSAEPRSRGLVHQSDR